MGTLFRFLLLFDDVGSLFVINVPDKEHGLVSCELRDHTLHDNSVLLRIKIDIFESARVYFLMNTVQKLELVTL